MRTTFNLFLTIAMFFSICQMTACSTAPKSIEARTQIRAESDLTLSRARRNDATLGAILERSAGYAVFPSVGKGAIGVGGAYGQGVLYENGLQIGYCDLSQGSIGLQLGGQSYSEVIVFETSEAVDTFKKGHFRFDAQATAVALDSGSGANAKFSHGVAVFTFGEEGLMYEASIGGQNFTYEPF